MDHGRLIRHRGGNGLPFRTGAGQPDPHRHTAGTAGQGAAGVYPPGCPLRGFILRSIRSEQDRCGDRPGASPLRQDRCRLPERRHQSSFEGSGHLSRSTPYDHGDQLLFSEYDRKTIAAIDDCTGGGTIAVTSSIAGRFGFPLRSSYAASKFALYGFFETLQAEYHGDNIRVVMVCPGRVRTQISFNALEADGTKHGRMDEGQQKGITADKAARKIVRAIKKQKPEVLVGGPELLMVHIKRFLPALSRRLARKVNAT